MDKLKAFWDLAANYPFLVFGVILLLIGAIGRVPLGANNYPLPEPWPWILPLIGLALMTVDIVRYLRRTSRGKPNESLDNESLDRVTGQINRPAENDTISSAFDTEGWVSVVKDHQHLWLIIETGNLQWPKAGEIRADTSGAWKSKVFEDGTGAAVSLSLFVANEYGHKKIEEWLDIGALTAYHPFEVDVPGTRRLARVDGLQRKPRTAMRPPGTPA